MLKAPPSWSIRVDENLIQITEDIIDHQSEGSPSCLRMVQRELNPRLGKDHAISPSNRLSRSPSPNRLGLASGSQPVLEFLDGYPANRRCQLSSEDSLAAVAGAPIKAISGGGVQCNTNRVR
jgi:hypothetical protein